MAALVEYVKTHGTVFFAAIAAVVRGSVGALTAAAARTALTAPAGGPGGARLGAATLMGFDRLRMPRAALHHEPGLLGREPGDAVAWCSSPLPLSSLIGVPLGIAAAHRPRLYAALRPVLDLMQTLPTFVYLIPTLVLFGLGVVPGLISTVIFALPAPVRLTQLGISQVPQTLLEAGDAFGATPAAAAVEGGAAVRRRQHPRRRDPVHHAQPLDGGDRSTGGSRGSGGSGGARTQHRAGRDGLRGGTGDRAARHHPGSSERPRTNRRPH